MGGRAGHRRLRPRCGHDGPHPRHVHGDPLLPRALPARGGSAAPATARGPLPHRARAVRAVRVARGPVALAQPPHHLGRAPAALPADDAAVVRLLGGDGTVQHLPVRVRRERRGGLTGDGRDRGGARRAARPRRAAGGARLRGPARATADVHRRPHAGRTVGARRLQRLRGGGFRRVPAHDHGGVGLRPGDRGAVGRAVPHPVAGDGRRGAHRRRCRRRGARPRRLRTARRRPRQLHAGGGGHRRRRCRDRRRPPRSCACPRPGGWSSREGGRVRPRAGVGFLRLPETRGMELSESAPD